jgi:hypothetical protein
LLFTLQRQPGDLHDKREIWSFEMTEVRAGSLAAVLALIGLSACQEPGQPGPTERAGIQIDHAMAGVQHSVGEFSGQAGQGLDDAGRSVGAAAQQVGSRLHDWLVPADTSSARIPSSAPPDSQPMADRSDSE